MKHDLKSQVVAIQEARKRLEEHQWDAYLDEILNDAGNTLAALNLTKDIPNGARDEYFEQLMHQVENFISCVTEEEEKPWKERILSISYDKVVELENRIQELEKIGPNRVIESAKQDPLI